MDRAFLFQLYIRGVQTKADAEHPLRCCPDHKKPRRLRRGGAADNYRILVLPENEDLQTLFHCFQQMLFQSQISIGVIAYPLYSAIEVIRPDT